MSSLGAAGRVVVLGSINMDIVVPTPHIPRPGETVLGGAARFLPGGKGANQAAAAAGLGGDVTFIGRTGDDEFGATLRADLATAGLPREPLRALAGVPSGIAFVAVDGAGENTIVVSPGANAALTPSELDRHEGVLAGAAIAITQLETPLPTVQRYAERCRRHGVPLLLNAAPVQPLPAGLLAATAYLVVNRAEVAALTGVAADDPAGVRRAVAAVAAAAAPGAPRVVVTLGADGCVAFDAGRYVEVPAFPVDVVDSTGAGDAFVGALGVALARGDRLDRALRYGAAAGALACRHLGARQRGPRPTEVAELLARYPAPPG